MMSHRQGPLDVLILIPFQKWGIAKLGFVRAHPTIIAYSQLAQAFLELEDYLGWSLQDYRPDARDIGVVDPVFARHLKAGHASEPAVRGAAAVALSTVVERAGLRWATIDPNEQDHGFWRHKLREYRSLRPRTVAINTTFLQHASWTSDLITLVRASFPDTKILIGGYQYARTVKAYLKLDADVFCIGEGEVRLPQIVAAVRDNRSLLDIPGLYVRQANGSLQSTGPAPTVELESLQPLDYSLAARIDPPVFIDRDHQTVHIETQRGCLHKCAFCTFRTIALPEFQEPRRAVETILHTGLVKDAYIALQDATASTPPKRWDRLLELLVEAGGTPHPMWCYTRVSDINDRRAQLMARAGLGAVQIGQESGHQRILDLMKKGTKIRQVMPAIDALGRADIAAEFSFIHGFPGETEETVLATRQLISELNQNHKDRPVVLAYFIHLWERQDLAGVDPEIRDNTPLPRGEDMLRTIVVNSKVPYAPANRYIMENWMAGDRQGSAFLLHPERQRFFRFAKAVDRAVGMFIERIMDGAPPDVAELRRVKEEIRAVVPPTRTDRSPIARLRRFARLQAKRRLITEAWAEQKGKAGALTRAYLAHAGLRRSGSVQDAARIALTAEYPPMSAARQVDVRQADARPKAGANARTDTHDGDHGAVDVLAIDLTKQILGDRKRFKLSRKNKKKVLQTT